MGLPLSFANDKTSDMSENRESVVLTNEGQKIFGILHLPGGVKNPPCVLICHGLGGHKTGRYRVYVELAEALVKENIAVFRFDFRGSGDSEGNFSDMTLKGEVSDALVALNYLKSESRIDTGRIGIFGRSLGGAVAILSAGLFGSIDCIALWAPLFNGEQWKHEWAKVMNGHATEEESNEMRRINGQIAGLPFYTEMFEMQIDLALKSLEHVPLLLIHGEKDTLININHSELYLKERHHLKEITEFIRLPNADHDFSYTEERALAIFETSKWFRRFI